MPLRRRFPQVSRKHTSVNSVLTCLALRLGEYWSRPDATEEVRGNRNALPLPARACQGERRD
jgi:hypothetical protein